MRKVIRKTVALALVLSWGPAFAQSVINEREAVGQIEGMLRGYCLPIPVGTHKTLPVALMSDQERALARSALAFEKAGAVTVRSVGSLAENIMTVELRPDFDKANLNSFANGPCLLYSAGVRMTEVSKIEAVQGGTSVKWNGALVYALYDYQSNPYYVRYSQTMGIQGPLQGLLKRKGIFLLRQDPFNRQWRLVTSDSASADAPSFQPKFVAQALRAD